MKNSYFTCSYFVPNKMQVDFNMLGTLMLYRISWEINNIDIITKYQTERRGQKWSS